MKKIKKSSAVAGSSSSSSATIAQNKDVIQILEWTCTTFLLCFSYNFGESLPKKEG